MTSDHSSRYGLPPALESWRSDLNVLASGFAQIVIDAGTVVMDVYAKGATVRTKSDSSPVCDADEKAEAFIQAALAHFVPGVPVLAEEAAARGETPALDGRFILVDPVDGTKEFLNRNGEFTINIALIDHGVPRAGAVYAPALRKLWFAGEQSFVCTVAPGEDLGAVPGILPLRTRVMAETLVVMASRSHADPATERFLDTVPVSDRRNAGSSLKFCALAEGLADLYPRFGPTMEWDTGAGDAVLRGAGGVVLSETGADLLYGKHDRQFRNTAFVAWGSREAADRWMAAGLAAVASQGGVPAA